MDRIVKFLFVLGVRDGVVRALVRSPVRCGSSAALELLLVGGNDPVIVDLHGSEDSDEEQDDCRPNDRDLAELRRNAEPSGQVEQEHHFALTFE
jgi:hypothetical protein